MTEENSSSKMANWLLTWKLSYCYYWYLFLSKKEATANYQWKEVTEDDHMQDKQAIFIFSFQPVENVTVHATSQGNGGQ